MQVNDQSKKIIGIVLVLALLAIGAGLAWRLLMKPKAGHFGAIAISAREQSTGLAEINTAVNHMDQSTQQNAAMVEETSAASTALAHEAARLRDLVVQFSLESPGAAARNRYAA